MTMPTKRRAIRYAQQLGLPEDVLLSHPRVVLSSNTTLTLENHQGILEYSSSVIRLRTEIGTIAITGKDMTLAKMGRHDLMLHGTIESVTYGK